MLAPLVEARREAQDFVFAERRDRNDTVEHRTTERQRAGLVDDQRVDPAQRFERLGVAEQDAARRGATARDHDRHRCRKSERAWARDDQHRNGIEHGVRTSRLGADQPPYEPRSDGDREHDQHEPSRDAVGEALHRCAAALRLRNHLHDLRQHRLRADLFSAHDQAARAVDRARR